MSHPYIPCQRLSLKQAGYDEAWLQREILANPSILGLGDLKPAGREVRQTSGGRLDFLFFDSDSDTMFEVELMLGATDESHIIRTLEYWDVESRRWPSREHRAVIVAEEITNRFFNVIWLLNRSIPIIAIKFDTLLVDGKVTINFTKVLDIYEAPEGRDPGQSDTTTRRSWEEYSAPESMRVFDNSLQLMSNNGKAPRITYNVDHIAVGGLRKNFAWFSPRRKSPHCMIDVRIGETNIDSVLEKLGSAGIDASRQPNGVIRLKLTNADLKSNELPMREVLALGISEGGGL